MVPLPELCLVTILEYTDAKTVYNFSRCSFASMLLVDRYIDQLPKPHLKLELDFSRLHSECWSTGETTCVTVDQDDNAAGSSSWILEVAILRDFKTPWEHQFKFIYKHIGTGMLILCDNELSAMIYKNRYWNTEVRINECTISNAELSFCRSLVDAVKPVSIRSAHIVETTMPNDYYRLRLQFEWIDDKRRRCLRYWNDFWSIVDRVTKPSENPEFNLQTEQLLNDYIIRLFTSNTANKCRLRLPPVSKEGALVVAKPNNWLYLQTFRELYLGSDKTRAFDRRLIPLFIIPAQIVTDYFLQIKNRQYLYQ